MQSTAASDYIDRVNEILTVEMKNTLAIIEEGREAIRAAADELIKKNHLTGAEFKAIMESHNVTKR